MRTCLVISVLGSLLLAEMNLATADPKSIPPVRREFCSPTHAYCLSLTVQSGVKPPRALAELQPATGAPVWSRLLPQEYGPRFALVSDSGETILFDEWITVASPMAVVMLGRDGAVLRQAGFTEIAKISGVPASQIVPAAHFGPWMVSQPVFTEPGVAQVSIAEKKLVIRLSDRTISVVR